MNKSIFQRYMKMDPDTPEKKYMFIVDDRELAEAIVCTGFPAVPILDYSTNEYDFSMDSFLGYLDSIAFSGTSHMDYVYVVACSSKMANRTLEDYFDRNSMLFVSGWRLFWKKEYLAKLDYQEELEKALREFIARQEGPGKDVEVPDLSRFHIINNKGVVTAVLDAEIVTYLIETTPMFILNRIPYLYEGGFYREDTFGIRIKSKIQGLIYQEFIRSSTLQRIYELLLIQPSIQCESTDKKIDLTDLKQLINNGNFLREAMKEEIKIHG